MSNLSFVSKLLEKVVVRRLSAHKVASNLYEPFQSAYRVGHSTETAVLRVQNDILRAIDSCKYVFLVLIDLSAAFDTVSHHILLKRLANQYGVIGDAADWIQSYLSERTQSVLVSGNYSEPTILKYGVLQGSVLGPGLFSDYSSPVASIIQSHGVPVNCYADDTQLYAAFHPNEEAVVLDKLEKCIATLRIWMNKNRLKLNDAKTEFVIFGTKQNLQKVKTTSIKVGDTYITSCKEVRNIGAVFDSEMKMSSQVNKVCKGAWINLHNISKVRHYLTEDQAKTVVHAYVTSKLDGNNALLAGIPSGLLSQIQRVQNAAVKVVAKTRKHDHVTPLLAKLHWLPIKDRILFKILLLTCKALQNKGPIYLKELFSLHQPSLNLRSEMDPLLLNIPKTRLKTFGDKAFSVVAAREWNNLPLSIRSSNSIIHFKSLLKTHLFERSVERDICLKSA